MMQLKAVAGAEVFINAQLLEVCLPTDNGQGSCTIAALSPLILDSPHGACSYPSLASSSVELAHMKPSWSASMEPGVSSI